MGETFSTDSVRITVARWNKKQSYLSIFSAIGPNCGEKSELGKALNIFETCALLLWYTHLVESLKKSKKERDIS